MRRLRAALRCLVLALRRSSSSLLLEEVEEDEDEEAPAGEEVLWERVELSLGLGERGRGMGSGQKPLESESSFTRSSRKADCW